MATRVLAGSVPDPDELYGRDDLIEHLWRQIQGNNILLVAPRRFGKTGIMRHVLLRPQPGFVPVYFELEDVDSPAEFVWRLTRELLSNNITRSYLAKARGLPACIGGWLKGTFDEVEFEGAKVKFKSDLAADWHTAARRLMQEMEKCEQRMIFIFDEFPVMLEKMIGHSGEKAASDLLAWFRGVRLENKDVLRRHRFIVGGSIGIDVILRRLNSLDKLNDFQRLYVEPLQNVIAMRLEADLAAVLSIPWTDTLGSQMLTLLGSPVPYFIHLFFSQLGQLPANRRRLLAPTDLDAVYRERILGPTCKSYFDHYHARLRRLGKPGEKAAMAVLRCVAGDPLGRVSRSALYDVYRKARGKGASDNEFDELLGDLEHDWYLVLDPNTNEFYFMLSLMRDWWSRWFPVRKPSKPSRSAKSAKSRKGKTP